MFLIRFGLIALVVLLFLPVGPRPVGPDGVPVAEDAGFCTRYPKTCAAGEEIAEALKHKLIFAVGWARERIGSQMAGARAPVEAQTPAQGEAGPAGGSRRWDGSGAADWSRLGAAPRDTLRPEDREPDWHGRP